MKHAFSKVPGILSQACTSRVDDFVLVTAKTTVGHFVHVSSHVAILGGATVALGDFCTVAGGVRIYTSTDVPAQENLVGPCVPRSLRGALKSGSVILEPFSALSANVLVMPGVTIGEGAVVNAGSIVTHSLDPWCVYGGRPLRALRVRPHLRVRALAQEAWELHDQWLRTQPHIPWLQYVAEVNDRET